MYQKLSFFWLQTFCADGPDFLLTPPLQVNCSTRTKTFPFRWLSFLQINESYLLYYENCLSSNMTRAITICFQSFCFLCIRLVILFNFFYYTLSALLLYWLHVSIIVTGTHLEVSKKNKNTFVSNVTILNSISSLEIHWNENNKTKLFLYNDLTVF